VGTLKLECVWEHRSETYDHVKAAITAWVAHYNESRPHLRLATSRGGTASRQSELNA